MSCYLSFKTYNVELCKDSNCDTPWIRESGSRVKFKSVRIYTGLMEKFGEDEVIEEFYI